LATDEAANYLQPTLNPDNPGVANALCGVQQCASPTRPKYSKVTVDPSLASTLVIKATDATYNNFVMPIPV
jgi:hypothetical protein